MSTFVGLIKEIPGISVDCFNQDNMNSSVYFLSHCHTDHMQGLDNLFFDHLKQYNKYLYCSRITKVFLENKYCGNLRNVETYVKDIEVEEKVCIEYRSNYNSEETDILFVTLVSAGHCPGSVMFIFEKMNKLILYTGDFRINPSDYHKIKSLNYCKDFTVFPKKFDNVYLDTTFLIDFKDLPTRIESINVMCKVVKQWLDESPRKVVILECSALYGSEFLYMRLSKSLKTLIHVKDYVYNSYIRIPELACHVTNNPLNARIHACMGKLDRSGLKCRTNVLQQDILTIVPSVKKWKRHDTSVIGEWDEIRENTFNVCYSTHASFNELKKFIQHFKPKEIYPCVCRDIDRDRINQLLDEIRR